MGILFLKGDHSTGVITMNVYLFVKKRQYIIMQCHWNHVEVKIFYLLEIGFFKNSSGNILGVLMCGYFKGLHVQMTGRHPAYKGYDP